MTEGKFNNIEILKLITQGNQEAFETLYKRYWLDLYDSAYKRLKNAMQAEDIVQEVFVSLWLRRKDLKIDNLQAYLYTAVKFKVFNYIERNRSYESFFNPLVEIALSSVSPDSSIIEKELHELLTAYINTLSEKKREIFRLHIFEQKTTKEISEVLGIPRKTVQNHLRSTILGMKGQIIYLLFLYIGSNS